MKLLACRAKLSARVSIYCWGIRVKSRIKELLPWIALTLFVILPLYSITVAFAVRTGVFNLKDRSITADEYEALWAFIASGIATTATVIGLLLTRTHNQRTLALQEDSKIAS